MRLHLSLRTIGRWCRWRALVQNYDGDLLGERVDRKSEESGDRFGRRARTYSCAADGTRAAIGIRRALRQQLGNSHIVCCDSVGIAEDANDVRRVWLDRGRDQLVRS